MDKSYFYTTKYHSQQMGLYKLLHKKHKIPLETIVDCIEIFRERFISPSEFTYSNRAKKFWTEKRRKDYTLELIADMFSIFLGIVTEKTGKTFVKNWKQKVKSYDELYIEASLDGSLAYNGVTDDF